MHNKKCTALYKAEEKLSILGGTLIRTQKIAISLETTPHTESIQCGSREDFVVCQKNYAGTGHRGELRKREEREVVFTPFL